MNSQNDFKKQIEILKDSLNRIADTVERQKIEIEITALSSLLQNSNAEDTTTTNDTRRGKFTRRIAILKDSLRGTTDTLKRQKIENEITALNALSRLNIYPFKDSILTGEEDVDTSFKSDNDRIITLEDSMPTTIVDYDSLQKNLPEDKKDNWIKRVIMHRSIAINEKYHGNKDEFKKEYIEKFMHSIPQMMFISLPLVALVLQLLYIRRRKQFFYVDHVIFIIHVYIAIFISLLIYYGFTGLYNVTRSGIFNWLETITILYVFFYCLMAMFKFYRQGFIKTFFKYLILLFIASILTGLLSVIFVVTSFFQI